MTTKTDDLKIAVNQPNFMPWLGYFDLLDSVDLFVHLDNVELSRRSFIARNRVLTREGKAKWLSLSLKRHSDHALLSEIAVELDLCGAKHLRVIKDYYGHSRYFDWLYPCLQDLYIGEPKSLSHFNANVIECLCRKIGIECRFVFASELCAEYEGEDGGAKTLELLEQMHCAQYYNFARGIELGIHRADEYADRGIKLFKQEYHHPEYDQGTFGFASHLSVLDLAFRYGPKSLAVIRSGRNWIRIV